MSETNRRQSFDDRICDDLSEVLLQYLTLKEKVILECVSKQFQRTLFEKQFDLYFSFYPEKFIKLRTHSNLEHLLFNDWGRLDWVAFESLLKKCPNIKSVVLRETYFHTYFGRHSTQFMKFTSLLIKYCHHLNTFDVFNNKIDSKIWNQFIEKFGSKLVSIDGIDCDNYIHLKSFQNIEELSIDVDVSENPILLEVKSLKKLIISAPFQTVSSVMQQTDRHTNIKYLDLGYCPPLDETEAKIVFNQISKFKHLIHLRIQIQEENCKLSDSWKKVFVNCTQLKSLNMCLTITSKDGLNIRKMITNSKQIKRLTLEVYFSDEMQNNPNIIINKWFSTKEWRQPSNISHYTLFFRIRQLIDESFLNQIDTTLPKLQYLKIFNVIATEKCSSKMAQTLSRLSRLETIKLKVNNNLIANQIEAKVIEKCRKIRSIYIKSFLFDE